MEKKELKTRYAKIDEDVNDDTGVYTDSIVEFPAIEVSFIALSKEVFNQQFLLKADTPQQKLLGPLLIPDLPILRRDNRTGELYNLIFTKEEIVKINRKRQKLKNINSVNVEHNDDLKLEGVISEETWIILDPNNDKANALGYDLPEGTLMTSIYIEDLETFNKLKDNYVGFSIEGIFNIVDEEDLETELQSITDYPQVISDNAEKGIRWNEEVNNKCATQTGKIRAQQLANREPISIETVKRMYSYLSRAKEYFDPGNKEACGTISYYLWGGEEALGWAERTINQYENKEQKTNKMKKLIKKLSDLFKVNLEQFILQDGTIVDVNDETMEATIGGEPAPNGTHILEDKVMAIVVEDGKLVEVVEVKEEEPEVVIEESSDEPKEEVKQVTYTLMDGSEIFVREEDGLAFKGDEVAPDGEYELEDGRILVIKDGRVEEIMTLSTALSMIKSLADVIKGLKEEKTELETKLEKLSKTTRALPKAEATPSSNNVELKKSDLMVNKLKQIQGLK